MVYKIFLDVNILLDYFIESRENHKDAVKLFLKMEQNEVDAFVSESVINTTLYLLQKYVAVNKLKQLFDELLTICTLLQCHNTTIRKAFLFNYSDLEDAILYQIAIENEMNFFISYDKELHKKLSTKLLPIVSTKGFLAKL